MTMTNDEINAKIARLRGWEHLPPPAMPAWQRPTDHGVEELWNLPDYAGLVCKAWELVDEMVAGNCVVTIEGAIITDGSIGFICGAGPDYFSRQTVNDETAPRAICLAYIAWKERRAA